LRGPRRPVNLTEFWRFLGVDFGYYGAASVGPWPIYPWRFVPAR
jgi:hypothetical protein